MANWLLDYIEMTEYIPPEFRDQSFSMRELDLKVSIAMSTLENEIKEFFSKIETLSPQDKQEQYEALLKKCEEASQVASTKIKIADRLHDLVEKSMRLLDQGLEKLKEDLIEGDKAYIVENIERRSQELDEQLRLEEETMLQRQARNSKAHHSKSSAHANNTHNSNHNHRHSAPAIHQIPSNHISQTHPQSMSGPYTSSTNHHHHNHHHHNRNRNNSTGGQPTTVGRQKKRERKRLNSAMTIFNRNSKTDEDSTNQTFLASPTTPEYLAGLHSSNSNSLNDVTGGDTSCLTLKGMMAGNRNQAGAGDKTNGYDTLAKARQPILTAKDAVHAVSPNPTNSDKLVSFTSNPNGDTFDSSTQLHNSNKEKQNNAATHISLNNRNHRIFTNNQASHLSNHLLSPIGLNNSGHNLLNNNTVASNANNPAISRINDVGGHANRTPGSPFSGLALSSRHDPIMVAASQAINATQNMTPGRRTSSLKASYAAVNSGRLQHPPSNHPMFDQANLSGKVYCKCRGTVPDDNMIACDNGNCKYEWFHYACVGITTPPAGEWYCDDCRLLARVQERPNTSKPTSKATGSVATTS